LFPTKARRREAEGEIAAFRRWRRLSRQFVEVDTKICQQRPIEERLS